MGSIEERVGEAINLLPTRLPALLYLVEQFAQASIFMVNECQNLHFLPF